MMVHEITNEKLTKFVDIHDSRWNGRLVATVDSATEVCRIECRPAELLELCEWLTEEQGFSLATLIVEDGSASGWLLTYIFYKDTDAPWIHVELVVDAQTRTVPSIVGLAQGPSADWHEREAEDLFGLRFEGHPRLGHQEVLPPLGRSRGAG